MADLFDPTRYAAVRRPLLEASTLPPECYTSPAFYEREVSNIFMRCWNLIGRADYVKRPGEVDSVPLSQLAVFHDRQAARGKWNAEYPQFRHRRLRTDRGQA